MQVASHGGLPHAGECPLQHVFLAAHLCGPPVPAIPAAGMTRSGHGNREVHGRVRDGIAGIRGTGGIAGRQGRRHSRFTQDLV